jgi:hypothetical protein
VAWTGVAAPQRTILGWKRVPATRVAMASSSLWPLNTLTLGGAGEVEEIHGAAAADASGGGLVGGYGRKLRQQVVRVDEESFERFRRPHGTRVVQVGLSRQ